MERRSNGGQTKKKKNPCIIAFVASIDKHIVHPINNTSSLLFYLGTFLTTDRLQSTGDQGQRTTKRQATNDPPLVFVLGVTLNIFWWACKTVQASSWKKKKNEASVEHRAPTCYKTHFLEIQLFTGGINCGRSHCDLSVSQFLELRDCRHNGARNL